MSTYDDWVVRFKVDTTELTKALDKVNNLRNAMNGLYSGMPGGAGRGRGSNKNLTPEQQQAQRNKEFYASQRYLNHHQRLLERDMAQQRKLFKAELEAYKEAHKRLAGRESEERKMAKAEIAAYKENAKRTQDIENARRQAQTARDRAQNSARNDLNRRRREEVNRLTAPTPGMSDMRSYYANLERQANQRSAIEQARQVELATMNATAKRQAERERQRKMDRAEREAYAENRRRTGQAAAAADLRSSNRSSNFNAAVETRRIRLDNLASRMGRYGVGDQTALANIRQALGAARNQTDLNALAPRMNEFVRSTNQAISSQARLERQMQRNNFAVRSMSNSMANLARSYLSVFAVVGAGNSIYQNAKEMENLQTKLLMGTGNKSEAATAYDYIKQRAKITGSDLAASTNLYAQLAITAKDAGFSKERIRKVYEDTTTMSIGFGLGAEQQKLVTKAIVQMMSKGSVQAEEFEFRLAA